MGIVSRPGFVNPHDDFGNSVPNFGGTVGIARVPVEYTDSDLTSAVPGKSLIVQVDVVVQTAFDAGTTNPIEVTDGVTSFGTANGGSGTGRITFTEANVATPTVDNVHVTYTPTGTAATEGSAEVWIWYIIMGDVLD